MHKEARTIKVSPDSEIATLIKEAATSGSRVLIDTGEAVYPLHVGAPAEPTSRRHKQELLALAGVWHDLDADRLIERVYEARRSAPPSPPIKI